MHSTRFQRLHQRFGAALTPSRIAFLAVLLYLISLIPIFLFSSYCHPLADDFTYGLLVHRAVVSGGGIPEILSAAAETVRAEGGRGRRCGAADAGGGIAGSGTVFRGAGA